MKQWILALVILFSFTTLNAENINPVISRALEIKQIHREDAKNIYLLRDRAWLDGTRVQVYRMPLRDSTHKLFVREVLQMSDVAFDKEWKRLVNAGLAPQIAEVSTENQMLAALDRKLNAVGYLSKDFLILNIGGHDVTIVRIID